MKKLLILLLLLLPLTVMGQYKFFRPLPNDLFQPTADKMIRGNSIWLPRPAATISAVQWNYDKTTKQFNATAFQSVGLGVGMNHYIEANGLPFCNYGFNGLILLGTDISAAVTVTALGIINAGVTYNISLKQFGLLTGVQIKF